jgi:hypothetical protein
MWMLSTIRSKGIPDTDTNTPDGDDGIHGIEKTNNLAVAHSIGI